MDFNPLHTELCWKKVSSEPPDIALMVQNPCWVGMPHSHLTQKSPDISISVIQEQFNLDPSHLRVCSGKTRANQPGPRRHYVSQVCQLQKQGRANPSPRKARENWPWEKAVLEAASPRCHRQPHTRVPHSQPPLTRHFRGSTSFVSAPELLRGSQSLDAHLGRAGRGC